MTNNLNLWKIGPWLPIVAFSAGGFGYKKNFNLKA